MEKRIYELVELLNRASNAYYNEDTEIMSNFEYDALYDELLELEDKTGIILSNSPTQKAGYEVVSKLKKVAHNLPALSLNKTKDRESLVGWLNGKIGVLSWKMDGLTIVANYENGKLQNAVTRGNGMVGEDVTHNAIHFAGLPTKINFDGKLTVRGEAVMSYEEFDRVNKSLPETSSKYKNPRNLASATVRLFDAKESASRKISFFAFDLMNKEGNTINSKSEQFVFLDNLGFNVVEYKVVTPTTVVEEIGNFETKLDTNKFPSDGLVLIFDDEKFGISLGMTGKFPRSGIAFKWQDETTETTLKSIEWSASRTGLLNPVAIFEPVEIEGTTVSRASIHNVSIAKSLNLGIGSKISVYKANLIIPQIANTIVSTGKTIIPDICPVCGGKTKIMVNDDIETLYCINPDCSAKHIGRFTHFVSRDCMNIIGLSEATLERFLEKGFIRSFADIYRIANHKEEIVVMDGFGEKSYNNLMESIENRRTVKFSELLSAISIGGIGKDMAKQISKFLGNNSLDKFLAMLEANDDFSCIEGIGEIINKNIYQWKEDTKQREDFFDLLKEIYVEDDVVEVQETIITNKVFVITGSVTQFKNRDDLKAYIESLGGKTANSVSAKTNYLINNDVSSNSSKNKKAKELGVPIISEQDFLNLLEN